LLLVFFTPQILLYVVAGTGAAVMNAFGRFASLGRTDGGEPRHHPDL
jgi:hypothetical protein